MEARKFDFARGLMFSGRDNNAVVDKTSGVTVVDLSRIHPNVEQRPHPVTESVSSSNLPDDNVYLDIKSVNSPIVYPTLAELEQEYGPASVTFSVCFKPQYKVRAYGVGIGSARISKRFFASTSSGDLTLNDTQFLDQNKFVVHIPDYSKIFDVEYVEEKLAGKEGAAGPLDTIYFDIKGASREDVFDLVRKALKSDLVEGVYFGTELKAAAAYYSTTPSDPKFPSQSVWATYDLNNYRVTDDAAATSVQSWWYNRHSFAQAWSYGQGNSSNKVAVLDYSFRTDSQWDSINWDSTYGWNVRTWSSDVQPKSSMPYSPNQTHGSECAYIIGAAANNGVGLCGGAPGATIVPVAIDTNVAGATAGINFARIVPGVKVINISMNLEECNIDGTSSPEQINLRSALNNAFNLNDINVVYASGNNQEERRFYPQCFTHAIVVGGLTKTNYPPLSGWGSRVDLAAASVNISSGFISGINQQWAGIKNVGGTSIAAPIVASSVAILRQLGASAIEAREILLGTADYSLAHMEGQPTNFRPMASYGPMGYTYGQDSYPKSRVLNAGAAAWVAAQGNARLIYRGASSDYTQTRAVDNSWSYGYWHPNNSLVSFSGGLTIKTFDYNDGTDGYYWAGSHAVFKNRRLISWKATGVPVHRSATHSLISPPFNNQSNGANGGWVNEQTVVIPN